jgi:hypothetical protein
MIRVCEGLFGPRSFQVRTAISYHAIRAIREAVPSTVALTKGAPLQSQIGGGDQSGARQKPSARPRARFVGRNVQTKVKKALFELSKMDQKASLRHVRKSGYVFSSKTLTILRMYGTCFRGFKSARLLSYEPGSMILIVTLRTPQ